VAIFAINSLLPTLCESPVVKTADTYELLWIKLEAYKPPIFIGSVYHPPKPIYNTNSFVDYLEATIDVINSTSPSSLIILAGDLNQLSDDLIVERTGLISIVKDPARGDNSLDRIYISIHSYQQTKIIKSSVKSDHLAILTYNGNPKIRENKTSTVGLYRQRTPSLRAGFLSHGCSINLGNIQSSETAESTAIAFEFFYSETLSTLNTFYPERHCSITSNESYFITPEIKSMLRNKN